MAQSIPDRSIINQLAVGYLDAYYSTVKLPPLPSKKESAVKGSTKKEETKTTGSRNGSLKKRGVKNGCAKH